MDFPATYYGKLDKRNPVIAAFERDIKSFVTLMRRVASSTSQDNGSYAKGIKILVEVWRKYKHRMPSEMYQERMLQIADFLFGMKLYQLALWQGYSLHLLQFSSVKITDITDVNHFMACFFPEGFDTDEETFAMKIHAMQGCALCIFELEKRHCILSQKGLSKLLKVLSFIRIMMQAFQRHEHLCWQIYKGSLHIYTICRYLMTMNYSSQALEYLLWASISLELSIPLMTAKYLPWIATLYCAVCHCYFDNQAAVQAEEFARRALEKINELVNMEEQSDVPAARNTQRAYKEASVKVAAMMFKRAVFEARKRTKPMFRIKAKSTVKDIPNAPWPRTTTERMLMDLFDSRAAQFLGILEALWDSTKRPLQTRMPDEPELQEVILELIYAGISILSGVGTTNESLCALTSTSNLTDLVIAGENKVPITSAVRFIKLLFQYKQLDAFTELAREMLQVLSTVEGQSFRRAELELALLDSFNSLLTSYRSRAREDNINDAERKKSSFSMSDEFVGLVVTLHKSVCGGDPDIRPDGDLVLDVVLFLWGKMKVVMQRDQLQSLEFTYYLEKVDKYDKWLWCLSVLCEVAFAFDLASVDCIMTAEMIHTLAIQLESAAKHCPQTQCPPAAHEADSDGLKPTSVSLLESSSTELLQKVCEVVGRGLEALSKGVTTLLPQDGSAITDSAFMQKLNPLPPSTSCLCSPTSGAGENKEDELRGKEKEEVKSCKHTQSTRVCLLAVDLHLELDIIHHRAFLKLQQLNAVKESELLDRIKKNKVSKALFLIQKALLVYKNMGPNDGNNQPKRLLEEASTLIEKAEVEERKLYISNTCKTPAKNKDNGMSEEEDNPPPAPILLSRTDHSLTFAPAPYYLKEQVCWYQLCGRTAEGICQKVRLGDCTLPGTGNMVPAVSGECMLTVEGLEPNQKYVFAVAAYNSQGKLLGNTIGATTFPLLASLPVPLLSTWAHLARAAFQTKQYPVAKRACRELWSHYTYPGNGSHNTQDRLATTGLCVQTLQYSSPHLCQLFLTSIFIETEVNVQQGSLCYDFSHNRFFIWEQEDRLAECERMLVAMDLAMWLNDGSTAVQAVVNCYSLLVPLIFHQITCDPVVQVLKKCLIVLEENSGLIKQKWTGTTSESFMHMIACITYYLSKASRVLREPQMASLVMDCGRRLLQEVYDAQLRTSRPSSEAYKVNHTAVKSGMKICPRLKALHWKNKKRITSEAVLTADSAFSHPLTACEDPINLYDLISNSALKDAYQDVMKLRCKPYFIELAALLLQRTMEEGHPDLVLKWGQSIFEFLSRRDEVVHLSAKCLEGNSQSKRRSNAQTQENEPTQNKNTLSHDHTRKRQKQKMPNSLLRGVRTNREMQAVENLLTMMSCAVQRHKKRIQLRNMCCEERVWKSHLNYSVAKAHLALLYQDLDKLRGGALQPRYSQLDPLCFSLAYSGMLVWKNTQHEQPTKYEVVSERNSRHSRLTENLAAQKENNKKAHQVDDSVTEESYEEGEDSAQPVEQQTERPEHTAALMLESLIQAALHLQRAMVLAHRGNHWGILQWVCQTVWDHSCRITVLVGQLEPPCPITADQLHNTFTSLLVLSVDLIMDMLSQLGLWSLYDTNLTEEELESSLHFSAPLDDSNQMDLRWVRTLVLHTLERLHDSGKWESLAHFALIFNSYTRERYALIVTPLIVHAQRRLLERIDSFGGPAVPQPHHVKTQKATGKKITYRNYAGSLLLSGWTPHPTEQLAISKKAILRNPPQDTVDLKGAEMQQSMSLVCVPLDVDDTLSCYRQALKRRPYCLEVLQHSRSLLLLLLAYTQPCFASQLDHCQGRGLSCSASVVEFSPIVRPAPNIQPCDLMKEDFSTLSALYRHPVCPDHMPTVIAAYSTAIKYLQANGNDSLRVLVLHEMGNLSFYEGNTRTAHLYWSKAVDCALKCSGAVDRWDGMSFGGGSMQQTLKHAGIWGCLHAAGLTAKIAQYILTSDISQRTKCCLLSAHLFKCVLCCSLAQPQADLQYAYHNIGEELLPGIDLFSEPQRVHLGTIVTSLNFVCHWLFTTGYYNTLLPILALYLHFVGTVCRDVQRSVEGKILKIRALTELCLFTEAVKESVQLTQGTGVLLPYGHYIANDNHQPVKMFYSSKCLQDNVEALEELVNCDFAPDVRMLYGPTLCLRFNLARIQLVLALSNTIHGPPVLDPGEGEACASISSSVNLQCHEHNRLDIEGSCLNTTVSKGLFLDTEKGKLTPERFKFLLLEGAFSLLHSTSQQLATQSCSEIENLELTIESNLLKANLYLQQGQVALSSEMAISSLVLLQTSPEIMRRSRQDSQKAASEHPNARTKSEQVTHDCIASNPLHGDCSSVVETSERIGVLLWLRCRLALFRSLAAHSTSTATCFPGKNINEEAARVLQEGLDECALWGDLNIQALLMVEGAELEAQRDKTDNSIGMLQEAISLLSGWTCITPGSSLTLARAILLLSDLQGLQSTTLLKLAQNLLKKQLFVFGQNVVLDDGKISFFPPRPSNIYLPYINILNQATLRIAGHMRDLSTMEMPVSAELSQSISRQCLYLSNQTESNSPAPISTSPQCSA